MKWVDKAWRCASAAAGLEKMEIHFGGGLIWPLRCFMPFVCLGGHAWSPVACKYFAEPK